MAKGFEYRVDGGSPVDAGDVLSVVVPGLSASTTYDLEVRKRDNAGSFSAWSSLVEGTTAAGIDMSYTIPFRALTGSNPADGGAYYVGDGWAGVGITSGTGAQFIEALKLLVPIPGTVTAVEIAAIYVDGSVGSNEAVTYSLHLNGAAGSAGSSTALGTATWDTATYNTTRTLTTGLSLAVSAGDLLLIKMIMPTWVTNPTGVAINGLIYVAA